MTKRLSREQKREKAVELVHKFAMENKYYERAKQCALIAVDEIIYAVEGKYDQYWLEVKQEIEKL
jgi:hypothetical protein